MKKTTKVGLLDTSEIPFNPATEDTLSSVAGMNVPEHDYIGLTYDGDNLTVVVYKTGGAGGATVATLTLAYTGSVLNSVIKS